MGAKDNFEFGDGRLEILQSVFMLSEVSSERDSLAAKRARLLKEHTEITENRQRRRLRSPTFETILEDNPRLSPEKTRQTKQPARRTASVQRTSHTESVIKKKPTRTSSVQNSTQKRTWINESSGRDGFSEMRRDFLREREQNRTRTSTPSKSKNSFVRPKEPELEPELLLFQQRPKIITSAQRREMARNRREQEKRAAEVELETELEPKRIRPLAPRQTNELKELQEAESKPKIMLSRMSGTSAERSKRTLQSSKPQAIEKPETLVQETKPSLNRFRQQRLAIEETQQVEVQDTIAEESKAPRRITREEEAPKRAFREDVAPKRMAKEEAPRRIAREEEAPRRVVREEEAPRRVVREEEVPRRIVREEEAPRRVVREEEAPRRVVREEEAPRRVAKEEEAPKRMFREEMASRRIPKEESLRRVAKETEVSRFNVQEAEVPKHVAKETTKNSYPTENVLSLNGTRRVGRSEPAKEEPKVEESVPEKSLIERIRERMRKNAPDQKQANEPLQATRARLGFSREHVKNDIQKQSLTVDSDSSYESEDSFEKPEVGAQTLGLKRKEPVKVEKFTSSHIERPRVKFDFSNVESMGQPVRPPSFVIEGLDDVDEIEPAEPKPFSEPTDFSKAYRFPLQYLTDQAGSTDDVAEEPVQPVEKKVEKRRESGIPRMPRQKPTVFPETKDDDDSIEFTATDFAPRNAAPKEIQKLPARKQQSKVELSRVSLNREKKFSESVTLDDFLKMETETKDVEDVPKEEFDKKCPNFAKLSAVVRRQLGKEGVSVLRDMTKHKFEHFVFLILQPVGQLEGVYLLRSNMQELVRLWGNGPEIITTENIDLYWSYNAASKQFESARIPGIRPDLDAVSF